MEETKAPEFCPDCNNPVEERKGYSEKTKRNYHFWSCSNKDCKFTWNPPSKADRTLKGVILIYNELMQLRKDLKDKGIL